MRILMINSSFGGGGPGSIAKDLYDFINKNGHSCFFAFGRKGKLEPKNGYFIGNQCSVYLHALISRIFDNAGFLSTCETKKLIKYIDKIKPDLVHLHNLLGYYINIEVLFDYLIKKGIPILWTLHDAWAFTGHCINPDYSFCKKWSNKCFNCPMKKDYPKSILMDNSFNNFKRKNTLYQKMDKINLVTPSKWLANMIPESIMKNFPVKVINNGLDLKIFKPVKSNLRIDYKLNEKIIVLCVAKYWHDMKGKDHIYALASILEQKYQIIMIGYNNDKNIPKNIIKIDKTNSREELIEWYSTANIFLNPTLGDNFPTVNLESIACGLPIITYDTGGSPEIVADGCGVIVERGNIKELYNNIINFDYKKNNKENCIAYAQKFDKDSKYNEYLYLYNNLGGKKDE